ncbi:MAG: 1-acyl-sn-glycerol-3-phosphate acyltransferase [Salinarimonadaceae bacterium]|nr:MAG: 1-acyl-sn-glycerol-3-phosphate acyltransferase [Salinarimonadaceae bacterium]
MLLARSILFNILFYTNLIAWMIALLPALAGPRAFMLRAVKAWVASSIWLLRVVAGIRIEFRGVEKIPPGGCIVASKHQSMLETFALVAMLDDPVYVLKRELMWLPFFGWYALKMNAVPVRRKGGSAALADLVARAEVAVSAGRQVIIFPEGTRRTPGAPPDYRFGIAQLYKQIGAPCLPVALNTGVFWPRRKIVRHPGTVVFECLDPIAPGLPRGVFFADLQDRIEAASDALLREAGGQAQTTD